MLWKLVSLLLLATSFNSVVRSVDGAAAADDGFNAKEHKNWGTYYDPQNVYCGDYDCYAILGFDYEEFGKTKPDTKEITKRYRSLSRHWHPDKNKAKDAKDRFVVSIQ